MASGRNYNYCTVSMVDRFTVNSKKKGGIKMLSLFLKILGLISPELRVTIKKSLDEWEVAAKETDTIMDDILVAVAKMLFGFSN